VSRPYGFDPRAALSRARHLLALLAECASRTVNAVAARYTESGACDHADQFARAVDLDMRRHWEPTLDGYLGRVTKDRILEAVREGVSQDAADNLVRLKKTAMAEATADRLKGKGWLPPVLRLLPLALGAK